MTRRKFSREFKMGAVKLIRERVCRWRRPGATWMFMRTFSGNG
ncbi:hypothetical protein CI1B_32960 [Bradyrhizobium ivorense]|uniref:Transposase n=1 Tax=Bradyrhizobium ivorense TaxID=2511166 RepID=A0A508T5G7_9BRAD|nr:hypothetical protein CI1B_32960 [Bradyrhizobium ivorense]